MDCDNDAPEDYPPDPVRSLLREEPSGEAVTGDSLSEWVQNRRKPALVRILSTISQQQPSARSVKCSSPVSPLNSRIISAGTASRFFKFLRKPTRDRCVLSASPSPTPPLTAAAPAFRPSPPLMKRKQCAAKYNNSELTSPVLLRVGTRKPYSGVSKNILIRGRRSPAASRHNSGMQTCVKQDCGMSATSMSENLPPPENKTVTRLKYLTDFATQTALVRTRRQPAKKIKYQHPLSPAMKSDRQRPLPGVTTRILIEGRCPQKSVLLCRNRHWANELNNLLLKVRQTRRTRTALC